MHSHAWLWTVYILGAILALLMKWISWVLTGKRQKGTSVWASTKEWFSISLMSDKVSWVTTFGIVWVGGYAYIDRVVFIWDWLTKLPLDDSIAFLYGTVIEYVAPNVTKWITKKFDVEG